MTDSVKPIPDHSGSFFKGRFLIVGFSERTGLSAALFFAKRGIRFCISDNRTENEIMPALKKLREEYPDLNIPVFCGEQTPAQLSGIDYILLSPGVPRKIPIIAAANGARIPVYNDVDLVCAFLPGKKIIGVTGTDGKTTVVTLLEALIGSEKKCIACGNNGKPVFEWFSYLSSSDIIIMELSSYMLEDIHFLRPCIGIITNVAEDHLDRYNSFEEYYRTKYNILKHCGPGDFFIRNIDRPLPHFTLPVGVKAVEVSTSGKAAVFSADSERIHGPDVSLSWKDIPLQGIHNRENTLLASAAAHTCGISAAAISRTLCSFMPLAHRMEPVPVKRDITVYNDSKATTIQAVLSALQSAGDKITLIAGGRGKQISFLPLCDYLPYIHCCIAYGEEGKHILDTLGLDHTTYYYNFSDAVRAAWRNCLPGGTLLLSPGCTSWDQFSDYQERGNVFKKIISELDALQCHEQN